MGCGASSSSDPGVVQTAELPAVKGSTETSNKAETNNASSTSAPADGGDDAKKDGDAIDPAEEARKKLSSNPELTPERKISYSRSFTLPFPAEDVWSLIADWNLQYLVTYSSKVSVSTGVHPDFPQLLFRSVKLPSGVFNELLLKMDKSKYTIEHVAVDGPVPFQCQFVHFKMNDHGSACQLLWSAYAWARPGEDIKKAQETMEYGVVNAVEVIKHTLRTRRRE